MDVCGDCQSGQSKDLSTANQSQTSGHPVRYATGALQLEETDLDSSGFGLGWGHTRSYNYTAQKYRGGSRGQSLNGTSWSVAHIPSIQVQPNGNVAVVHGRLMFWFARGGDGQLRAMFPFVARLTQDQVAQKYSLMLDDSGLTYGFDAQGRFESVTNPAGEKMSARYDGLGRLVSLPLTSSGTSGASAAYTYTYVGRRTDRLSGVLYQVNGANVRRVSYTYYAGGDARGNAGDLATVAVEGFDSASGKWYPLRNFHYRYWKPTRANGFTSGLKYAVGAQAHANLVAAGLHPLTASDAQVAQYADLYIEYTGLRVSKEVVDGGAYTYCFRYQARWGNRTRNSWTMKTTELLPGIGADGKHDRNVVYTNAGGQVMLKVFISGGQKWGTYYRYDTQGTCVLEAQPSAIASYDEGDPALVTLKPHYGLVQRYEYKDAEGYGTQIAVAQGEWGLPVRLRTMKYQGRRMAAGAVRFLVSESVYQRTAAGGTVPARTTYDYTWRGNSLQPAQCTTTLPVVSAAQNGSGRAASRREVYDVYGNVTWAMDERGFITQQVYDDATGALVQSTQDVQTSQARAVPAGWVTPAGGGLHLTRDYTVDVFGRTTRELGPLYSTNPSLVSSGVRRATWTVYRDDLRQVWQAQGEQVHSRRLPEQLTNPVSIIQLDHAGRTIDQIQATRADTNEALAPTDAFPQTSWNRWTHHSYDRHHKLTSTRQYFLIPARGTGLQSFNYNESLFDYDDSGEQNRQVSSGGTITRTVFHPAGWTAQTWVGSNDTGATDKDPSGHGTAGNNMVLILANQYDGGRGGGDGVLTQTTLYQDATTTRVTRYGYDFRNRRTSMTPPDGATEAYTLDNQNRVIQSDRLNPVGGKLVARSATRYDAQGRVYQTLTYAVDPVTGVVGNALTSQTWYDPSGNVIQSQPAGARLFTKTAHDGVGRPTVIYQAYRLAATGYPYPVDVSHDMVIQQSETRYDAADNALARITCERNHDATGTGALTTPSGAQPQARVSYQAVYFDILGRTVAVANYGTNGGAAWQRYGTVPAASDTVLVSLSAYDVAGNLFQQTDPRGIVNRSSFDQAGRLTQTLENYVANGTAPDQNRTTNYTYNADGKVATLTALNDTTGNQVTHFVYGSTLADSDVVNSTLLVAKVYPQDTPQTPDRITYAYNRQGELKRSTDANGTVHQYVYDALGRSLHDQVTTLGGGVDGAVRRISRSYEVRGMLAQVTSYDNATPGQGQVVNDVLLTYDGFGQLVADYQAHVGAVDPASTPCACYTYADGSANTIRRTGLTYPDGRVLTYSYGAVGSLADSLSRLDAIVDDDGTTLASFTYMGLDTRVQMQVG